MAVFSPFQFNTKPMLSDMIPEIDTDYLLERYLLEEHKQNLKGEHLVLETILLILP